MRLILNKKDGALYPAFSSDADTFAKIKDGENVSCEIKRHRNLLHHRKFFAMLKMVCDNVEKWEAPEQLLIALKVKLGYVNLITGIDGETIVAPGSIRFEAIDQDSFEKLYEYSMPILAAEMGVSVADMEKNFMGYM